MLQCTWMFGHNLNHSDPRPPGGQSGEVGGSITVSTGDITPQRSPLSAVKLCVLLQMHVRLAWGRNGVNGRFCVSVIATVVVVAVVVVVVVVVVFVRGISVGRDHPWPPLKQHVLVHVNKHVN